MTERRVVILGRAQVDEVRDPGGVRETVAGDAVRLASALRADGLVLTVVAPVAVAADDHAHQHPFPLSPAPFGDQFTDATRTYVLDAKLCP